MNRTNESVERAEHPFPDNSLNIATVSMQMYAVTTPSASQPEPRFRITRLSLGPSALSRQDLGRRNHRGLQMAKQNGKANIRNAQYPKKYWGCKDVYVGNGSNWFAIKEMVCWCLLYEVKRYYKYIQNMPKYLHFAMVILISAIGALFTLAASKLLTHTSVVYK